MDEEAEKAPETPVIVEQPTRDERVIERAYCDHAPDESKKQWTPKGWATPCKHCGIAMLYETRVMHTYPGFRNGKQNMSKKERLRLRKEEKNA